MVVHRNLYRQYLQKYQKGTEQQIYRYALNNGAEYQNPDEKYRLWSVRRSLGLMVDSGEIAKHGNEYVWINNAN